MNFVKTAILTMTLLQSASSFAGGISGGSGGTAMARFKKLYISEDMMRRTRQRLVTQKTTLIYVELNKAPLEVKEWEGAVVDVEETTEVLPLSCKPE